MAEFIEKKKTFQVLRRYYHHRSVIQEMALREALDMVPAANVKPVVHGKWIKLDMHKGMEQYKCSVCRSECYVPECMGEPMYCYCPNCGADMKK